MKFLLLAGGKGSRLNKVLVDTPKPLARIKGKPFIEKILENIIFYNPDEIYIAVCYLKEKIISELGHSFRGYAIKYIEETTPLGTGGALINGLNEIKCNGLFVLNADTYTEINFQNILEVANKKDKSFIVIRTTEKSERFGTILFDKNDKVLELQEKEIIGPSYINCGCYYFHKKHLKIFQNNKIYSLEKEILNEIIKSNNLYVYKYKGKFIDIGVPIDLKRAQNYI